MASSASCTSSPSRPTMTSLGGPSRWRIQQDGSSVGDGDGDRHSDDVDHVGDGADN